MDLGSPVIASDADGNFVIAWEENRDWWFGYSDIKAQLLSRDREPVGENFKVNTDTGEVFSLRPSRQIQREIL